jgi:hypothetical protein
MTLSIVALLAAVASSGLNGTSLVNVKTDFGAKGDGTDDYKSIQAAIDYARTHKNGVFFPPGDYMVSEPLNFGFWRGILVKGGEPGDAGISGGTATVTIAAYLVKPAGACHEFSGSGYGSVSGIYFTGTNCKVMILNARTSNCGRPLPGVVCDNYGSDLVFSSCNFNGAPVAAFANHMGEVLTWRDCRFHSSGGSTGLLLTWRLGSAPYNIKPPSGATLTTGITLTVFRIFGGEFTGDNSALITLDMEDTPTHQFGTTVTISGTYFAGAGVHMAAVQVRGKWHNVHMTGNRFEDIPDNPSLTGNRAFVELAGNNTMLSEFTLSTFGDCCTTKSGTPVIAGVGKLESGTVTSNGDVIITEGHVYAVTFHAGDSMQFKVNGDVGGVTIRSVKGLTLNVTGVLDLDDGGGGWLIHQSDVASNETSVFVFGGAAGAAGMSGGDGAGDALDSGGGGSVALASKRPPPPTTGLLQASFAGAVLMLQCVSFAGGMPICAAVGQPLTAPGATGVLGWGCKAQGGCHINASSVDPSATANASTFEVRRTTGFW